MLITLNNNRAKYYCVTPAKIFGQRVADARKAKGLNQRDFGLVIGVSPTYVSYIERGYNPASKDNELSVSAEVVEKIAKYFGWNIGETLLSVGYAPPLNTPEYNERVKSYAESMLEDMQRSGFDDLEDEAVQARVMRNVARFAEIMIQDEIEEQNKGRRKKKE